MNSVLSHLVLLLAVVSSQILSGNSCCCLGRASQTSLNVGKTNASSATLSQQKTATSKGATKSSCPRCSASQDAIRVSPQRGKDFAKQSGVRAQVGQDVQCRCVKQCFKANNPRVQHSLLTVFQFGNVPEKTDEPRIPLTFSHKFEIPLRFGGNSWQSVACIWMI
jgi:hypothetical protein